MTNKRQISISDALQAGHCSSLGSSAVVAQAVLGIEKLIFDRRFIPGQRLIEADLVRELGLARGPIREALRILAGDWVVELVPNRGAQIRVIDRTTLIEMVYIFGRLFCIGTDLFTARQQTDRPIEVLRAIVKQMKQAAMRKDKRALSISAIEYHQVVLQYSGNRYLCYLLQRVHISHYLAPLDASLRERMLGTIASAYGEITKAIISKSAARANAILMQLVTEITAEIEASSGLQLFDQATDPLVGKSIANRRSKSAR